MGFVSEIIAFILGFFAKFVLLDLLGEYLLHRLKDFVLRRASSRYTQTDTPSPPREFHCFRIGNFEIPAMPVIGSPETPFRSEEVTVSFRPVLREEQPNYPVELKAARRYLIEEHKRRLNVAEIRDNVLPRIDNIEQMAEDEEDRRGGLRVSLSLTTFGTMCATNSSLDYQVIPQTGLASRFTSNQTIRQAYTAPPYEDLTKSLLANPPGVEVVIISRSLNQDPHDQLIVRLRSQSVAFYHGFYQVSASGYMSLAHSDSDGIPSPFITAIEEARQEIADSLSLSPQDFNLIGFLLHWQGLGPAFFGYIETGMSVYDLLGDFRRDSHEGYLHAIPFEPTSVLSHIAEEKWTPASALAVISTLLAFYPRSEVETVARALPAKTWEDFMDRR